MTLQDLLASLGPQAPQGPMLSSLTEVDPSGSTPQPAPLSGLPLAEQGPGGVESLSGGDAASQGATARVGGPGLEQFVPPTGDTGLNLTAPNLSSLFGGLGQGNVAQNQQDSLIQPFQGTAFPPFDLEAFLRLFQQPAVPTASPQPGPDVTTATPPAESALPLLPPPGDGTDTTGTAASSLLGTLPKSEDGSGGINLMALIQSILGLGASGAALLPGLTGTEVPKSEDGSGTSPQVSGVGAAQSDLSQGQDSLGFEPGIDDPNAVAAVPGGDGGGFEPGIFDTTVGAAANQFEPGIFDTTVAVPGGDGGGFEPGVYDPYVPGGSLFGDLSSGFGAVNGLVNLAGGISNGNPSSIISGATGAYQGIAGLSDGALPAISSELLGALSVPLQAGAAFFDQNEMFNALNSGWYNNPIRGALSSASTSGTATANEIFDYINQAGVKNIPTDELLTALGAATNAMMAYYATAQGGTGAIKASDTFTGGSGQMATTPLGGAEQYTANFTQAQQGLSQLVQALLDRGVTYEQIGQAPTSGGWAQQSLDMDPTYLNSFYNQGAAQYDPAAWNLLSKTGYQTPITGEYGDPTGGMQQWIMGPDGPMPMSSDWWTPSTLFQAAQGSDPYTGGSAAYGSGNIAGMFGGAEWLALARMGLGGPEMQQLIAQHFNPWQPLEGLAPGGVDTSLAPIIQGLIAQLSQQNVMSGGGDGGY